MLCLVLDFGPAFLLPLKGRYKIYQLSNWFFFCFHFPHIPLCRQYMSILVPDFVLWPLPSTLSIQKAFPASESLDEP